MAYITIAEVRAAGLTDTVAYPDADITAAIALWQSAIERATRQWFESKTLTLAVDGNNSDTLYFGIPIIAIEYVKLNEDTAALDTDYYVVYNGRSYPDDRRNPRIKLKRSQGAASIYSEPVGDGKLIFRKGRQNQAIKGTFGFLEDDDSTPPLIKRALLKLVLEKLQKPPYAAPGSTGGYVPPILAGVLKEEWTDGHKVKMSDTFEYAKSRPAGFLGFTQDPEIIAILKMYRAPIGIATPADWTPR